METEILYRGRRAGTLRALRQGLYMEFRGELSVRVLSKLYVSFESGEFSLGVPVPRGQGMFLRASVPASRLPSGQLLRAELRPLEDPWEPFPGGEMGGVHLPEGYRRGQVYRFPWEQGAPLPADEYLCFYAPVEEQGQMYLELKLTDGGQPEIRKQE